VLEALLIVAGIALVDMLNPATIAPALVLAVSPRPVPRVLGFGVGYFLVNLAGGILIVLGPGQWIESAIPSPGDHLKHVLELVGGVLLLTAALVLVLLRGRLARAEQREEESPPTRRSNSAVATGAGLALVEFPTAFPYFAAIAVIEAAALSVPKDIVLIFVFNAIFLAPVFLLALVIGRFPKLQTTLIEPLRRWIGKNWPLLLAGILALAGAALVVVGAHGLMGD
jgi:cytochrome c biogenesis protein CcdA